MKNRTQDFNKLKTLQIIEYIMVTIYSFSLIFYYGVSSPFNRVRASTLLWVLFVLSCLKSLCPTIILFSNLIKNFKIQFLLGTVALIITVFTILCSFGLGIYLILLTQFSNYAYSINSIGNDPLSCCIFFNESGVDECNQTKQLLFYLNNSLLNLSDIKSYCTLPDGEVLTSRSQLALPQSLILFIAATVTCMVIEIIFIILSISKQQILKKILFPKDTTQSNQIFPNFMEKKVPSGVGMTINRAVEGTVFIADEIGKIFNDISKSHYPKEKIN